jgi:hypothetical protein
MQRAYRRHLSKPLFLIMKLKSIEKLILVVIAFLIVSRISVFLKDLYLAYYTGVDGPTLQQKVISQHISFILFSIVNIGISIWLLVESRRAELGTYGTPLKILVSILSDI